ncbi:iron-containing alcohol dehydrogenase [Desulfopila inferna]|uniref:iron-containing alcohol dehydrogenase n=1 Tax=Desulfopila inferna TaxID=468528 RepID=UPI001962C4D8|nr:iron-containing alcohol dehydrogenase [Desulfopila inferna]MBM9604939.1 iron-containing alcohol dehydrogenase [Desulfopila inferna]
MNFSLKPLPRIYFGPGKIVDLTELVVSFGNTVLFIIGKESFGKSPFWAELRQSIAARGISFHVEHISGEPSPQSIDAITGKYRKFNINAVAAIGGGSVLDSGKAVSAMLATSGSVLDYLEGVGTREPEGRKIPFIAVPTTSGTGSEVTSNAVISRVGKDGFKKSLRHDGYIPDVALVDPALTLACPPRLTANCAMDAFSQLVESYLSTKASPFTDDLALGALRKVKKSLTSVHLNGGNIEDRSNMSYGSLISGITLANAGLGVIHGFASVIGGLYPIPHGVVCGTLMAAGNEVTLHKLRKSGDFSGALRKYAKLGKIFSDRERGSDEYYQDSFIADLQIITATLGMELLGDYGISSKDLSAIAEKTGSKNNPVVLERDELEEILSKRK